MFSSLAKSSATVLSKITSWKSDSSSLLAAIGTSQALIEFKPDGAIFLNGTQMSPPPGPVQ